MNRYHHEPLPLAGAFLLRWDRYVDERGYFAELFRTEVAERLGLPTFVQDNLSFSRRGVLRGLHFQRAPYVQAKLVTVLQGRIQDVLVDLRPSSATYRQSYIVLLTSEGPHCTWVYVPPGFAHGFYVLSDEALVLYRCSAYYAPQVDGGVRWDDPDLGIPWEVPPGTEPILSPKDAALPRLKEQPEPFPDL